MEDDDNFERDYFKMHSYFVSAGVADDWYIVFLHQCEVCACGEC